MDELFVLGRGLNYTTALETALKIMETSYARARAYFICRPEHGPVAAAQAVPCIVYTPRDAAHAAVGRWREATASRHAADGDLKRP